jgi:hypothetical protein
MRRIGFLLCLLAVLLVAAPSEAVIGAFDTVPAATLLLPYFEVDVVHPGQVTTLVTIGNSDSSSRLAHVTLWTDVGIPTINFDIYLAGYALAEVDLRQVFAGNLPQTSPDLANQGNYSGGPVAFPGCGTLLPPQPLTAAAVTALANAHTGAPSASWGNQCGGTPVGDGKARGYVTIDVVNSCSTLFPSDVAYFAGVAADSNVLFGQYSVVDRLHNQAFGDSLVAIEASATDPLTTTVGAYTFYGRLVNATAADHRERLAATWMARYTVSSTTLTRAIVWRDAGRRTPFVCSDGAPNLTQREATPFDEREHATDIGAAGWGGIRPVGWNTRFPRAAERVNMSDPSRLPIPYSFGWFFFDLHVALWPDPLFGGDSQAYVGVIDERSGVLSGARSGWLCTENPWGFYPVM